MATLTSDRYLDAAACTAGEAMTINSGAQLTVRTDYRVHANAPASNTGSLGSVTINAGKFIWDSTAVRWLAYNSGSGNVPAIGTTVTQSGISGYLLGVWASKTAAQTAVGASMPTSGFIKFREVTGGAFAAGALSGIGATATGADVQGWISLPHDAAANFTIPRLGEHRARGGRFFLETTSGSIGQVFQVPTDGSAAMYAPGLWVETGEATNTYEYWPGLYSSTNGWSHLNIGEATGSTDKRQNFVKILAGGQLQMGEAYTQASTYASLAAQAGTYATLAHSCTYTWADNKVEVYYSSGHLLVTGQQVGLDFTSGGATAYDGTYTVTVTSPYHYTVDLTGSGAAGNVTARPGVTITFTAHALNIGEQVYCDFTSGTGVDGTYEIYAVTGANAYIIKYPHTAALTSGNVSCLHTLVVTFTAHGMALGNKVYLDFTSGTGTDGTYTIKTVATNTYNVNFAHSATTSGNVTMMRTIGNVAPANCRTWIPSNILHEVATGARATNTVPNTTIASRPEWITTSAGAIDLEYVYGCSGYPSFAQAYSVRMRNCAFFDTLIISECATALDLDNVHTSMQGALDTPTLSLTSNFAGGTIANGKFQRGNTPGTSDHAAFLQYCKGLTLTNVQAGIIQYVRSTGYPFQMSYCSGMTMNDCRPINGTIALTACMDMTLNDTDYVDRYNGRTNATTGYYAVNIGAGCSNIVVDGMTFGFAGTIQDCHPYSGLVTYAASSNLKFRNIGTAASKLSGGTWAPNTYGIGYAFVTGGNNNTVKVQMVFLDKVRTATITNVNSDKNMLYESLDGGFNIMSTMAVIAHAHADLNGQIKGMVSVNSTTGQASVYGTHFADIFMGTGYGRVFLAMNEPTSDTSSVFTMNSGTAKWNSSGGILLASVGDQATWTDTIYRKGHTGFSVEEAVLSGPTQTRFDIHYQLDSGSGFGSWHNLYYQRAGGSGTSGQYTFDVTDATGVEVGDYIWGTGRANIGKVTEINGNTITSDVANSAMVSGVIRFNRLPYESISPSTGFKLKFRLTVIATETVACAYLRIGTTTSAAAQANYYPLDTNTLTVTGIVSGSDVVVYDAGTETVLGQSEDIAGTTYQYVYSGADTVDIGVFRAGHVPYFIRDLPITTTDTSVPVAQVADRAYLS